MVKNTPAGDAGDARDKGSIPGLGKSSGGGNGNPLQYSCLENSMAGYSPCGQFMDDSACTHTYTHQRVKVINHDNISKFLNHIFNSTEES